MNKSDQATELTTLITGTRKGIGRFLAEHYLAQGHRVIGCSRSACDLQHDAYTHFELDVADEKATQKMFAGIRKQFGGLDHLINNAGTASMNHSLLTPGTTVDKLLKTNFIGTFYFCREAAKLMKKFKYGRIVNFTTVAVPLDLEGEAIYVSSKAAVEALTRVLAKEFAEFGITLNCVGPVPVQTDLIRAVPEDKIQQLIGRQAIKRFGRYEDVLNIVDFYLRPQSGFITGQTIYLGGVF
jgi:3-oxoacyl-[acyl-carrier protein] reductase